MAVKGDVWSLAVRMVSPALYALGRSEPGLAAVAAVMQAAARRSPDLAERVRRATYDKHLVKLAAGITVTARRQGVLVDLNLSGNLDRCLFFSGTYENEYLNFLRSELRPGDTYIDIGGHIGLDAFVVAKAIGHGRIVCFEPSPDSAATIRRGAKANYFDFIEVVQKGLGNETGTILLRSDPDWLPGDSAVRSRYNTGTVVAEAPLVRLDDWASTDGLARMDVVKLDVEGCELDAILGMSVSLRRLQPRAVIVEVGEVRLAQANTTAAMIDDALAAVGYQRTGEVMLENVVYRPAS